MKVVQLKDGRRLAYREAGRGRPLVLLHGWSLSAAVFTEVLPAMADNFRVMAPDLRGHGGTENGSGYLLDDFVDDLRQWLDALGITECDLLGWSLGGQVAMRLCTLLPARVGRLLLVSTTPRFLAEEEAGWIYGLPKGQVKAMERGLRRRYRETLEDFFNRQFGSDELSAKRREQVLAFSFNGDEGGIPEVEVAQAALHTLCSGDLRAELIGLKMPALVLHGERDEIIPVAAGRYLADHLPNAIFAGLNSAGHAPFLTRLDRCCDIFREFLQA
ncbi:MAG: alpha/beta fold hydrolase [Syntrophotaleaceae bacterium]